MNKIQLLGVTIDLVRPEEVLDFIRKVITQGGRALISNVNVRALNLAYEHEWFRSFLNGSDLVFCDGMGVKLGAWLLGYNQPERFTPADWIWKLAAMSAQNDFSVYLLGNPSGVADRAAERLKERFPGLKIAGAHHGYFDKTLDSTENQAVLQQLNEIKPNIVLVGFGMPIQERWLWENRPRLQVNVAIPCGALFEYLSGDLLRGPRWMTDNYLEWLARMVISPRRYGKRYLRDVPFFLYRILKQRFSRGAA